AITRAPSRRASSASSSAVRDFPIPGSPTTMTSAPSPPCARRRQAASRAISSSRPTNGVVVRNAVGSSASYSTSATPTASLRPFSACGPPRRDGRQGAGAEDLARLRRVAEAACGHDGRPEVAAAAVAHDLADVEADAHPQPLAVDRTSGALLHRDRAAHRVGGGGEGGQLPVPQPLEVL